LATRIEEAASYALVQLTTKGPPNRPRDGLQTGTARKIEVEATALERELRAGVEGDVVFDESARALYASNASNYRMAPIGAVLPRNTGDVLYTLAASRRYGAPVIACVGGTGMPGQTVNVAVVLDFSRYMNRLIELNAEEKYARVQPGLVLDDLRRTAKQHRLTFGPDPATRSRCTLGGTIGNNSCGTHPVIAGMTADNIDEPEIATYDGVRMTAGATTESERQQIISADGRRGEIYARLKSLLDANSDRIRSGGRAKAILF